VGRHKTKKAAVTAALEEYIRARKRVALLEMAGTVDYDADYDYKAERNARRKCSQGFARRRPSSGSGIICVDSRTKP
jgi:hypothetical protein